MLIVLCLSSLGIIFLLLNSLCYRKNLCAAILVSVIISIFIFTSHYFATESNREQQSQPNIIMLGIDSLSPESINKDNMPFLHQLLSNSMQFTNAISPLARTYPAWTSMLTGLYAEHHHAEENLVPKQFIESKKSIIWMLDKQGYDTIYATDDRRFNSIDKDFGFKQIIGPKLGVNDILLGTFNDFPLSNLLINACISARFFPYNYINRASFFSYYPSSFDSKLRSQLSLSQDKQPLFLAVHFTLPHWPYAWAESSPEEVNNEFSILKRARLYQSALRRVDKQFASFFNFLQKNHYFHNSIVIILSDHGEVIYSPNTRLTNYQNYQGTPPSRFAQYLQDKTATVLNKSAGHGSDILSPKQYHSVLAFNIYKNGKRITSNHKINTRIALIDIAPTILDFLHLKNQYSMDGISLLPAILNPQAQLPERAFFIESGMFPNQLLSKEKAMEIGKEFYTVNPNSDELEIKQNKLKYFDDQKLYGIISGNWVLALYPDDRTYIAVIQNLSNGEWTDDLHSTFAQKTPASVLSQQLYHFYGKKLFLPLP
ncbi:sulfatase-like hydrolase/transferase [Legionella fallonii]|nr:sulfatase-like hydrolase/transferase [Legionella fallonii]